MSVKIQPTYIYCDIYVCHLYYSEHFFKIIFQRASYIFLKFSKINTHLLNFFKSSLLYYQISGYTQSLFYKLVCEKMLFEWMFGVMNYPFFSTLSFLAYTTFYLNFEQRFTTHKVQLFYNLKMLSILWVYIWILPEAKCFKNYFHIYKHQFLKSLKYIPESFWKKVWNI